jgi:lipopolysaccharide transport system permease protein
LWFLALRDVQVIYKQTLLGVLWAIIRPTLSMVVFTLLMGKVLGIERMSDPVFVFAGLVPWTLFASYVTGSTNSLVNNAALVTKVYFPRLLMPLSAIGVPLVDFAMSMTVLAVMMVVLGSTFSTGLWLLGPLVVSTIVAALGVGIGLSAVTVYFRDVRHAIPFLIQTMFFVTPVMYPKSIIPQAYHWVYLVNPIAGPIEAFRAVITGTPVDLMAWGCSTAVATALFLIGVYVFSRAERKFADVV